MENFFNQDSSSLGIYKHSRFLNLRSYYVSLLSVPSASFRDRALARLRHVRDSFQLFSLCATAVVPQPFSVEPVNQVADESMLFLIPSEKEEGMGEGRSQHMPTGRATSTAQASSTVEPGQGLLARSPHHEIVLLTTSPPSSSSGSHIRVCFLKDAWEEPRGTYCQSLFIG